MAETVRLGEITCPSGELVVMDGGYLGLWSGDRAPESVEALGIPPCVDFEIIGPDAIAAARAFDRQAGLTLYDIPSHAAESFQAGFGELCHAQGFSATMRSFPAQIPHRERVSRAIADGEQNFIVNGVPVVAVGGIPDGQRLVVTARASADFGWEYFRIELSDRPAVGLSFVERLGVDNARLAFADATALNSWVHDDPIDGLADVVFWGLHENEIATEFAARRTSVDGSFGWLNLPANEAYDKAVALDERRQSEPECRFAFDFRPHSHHWQVMAGVRAAEHEAATIHVGGSELMFAMTSVGDGFFPVLLELDETGVPVAIRIQIQALEEE